MAKVVEKAVAKAAEGHGTAVAQAGSAKRGGCRRGGVQAGRRDRSVEVEISVERFGMTFLTGSASSSRPCTPPHTPRGAVRGWRPRTAQGGGRKAPGGQGEGGGEDTGTRVGRRTSSQSKRCMVARPASLSFFLPEWTTFEHTIRGD